MGILIILEGGDGSGKATQTARLKERLVQEGYRVKAVSFPNYDSGAAMPIKMYLAGEFGKDASDVNPYVASSMYAIDRFASFRQDWQEFYEQGGIILADRYTTSNMVHQMVKYTNATERTAFLDWLEDFEFGKFELPRPDAVCLLDVPLATSEALMAERKGKTGGETGDIHEKDRHHLAAVHGAYDELVNRYGWHRIACTEAQAADTVPQMRSVESIHDDVYSIVMQIIKSNV
ncbi:thymidylate kinase [Veillonella sp. YH-vei2232]|jgi:dTMP kinase|uniref:Thymidylate kinase n=1 Tax=Veillonella absiana TaxID=3079305 RepID=A0ABU3Z8A8_9FIRM|nr:MULTISPECIES: thymidylate kinase [unclassified Veillonella]NCB95942.1 thymidylate kinase [Negativicutes bacterium]MBK7921737.1 thymidylate kinase [Veillonella sp.]MBP6923026.1 thymidylate kinase [Veillonella sp.]MBP8616815.1 thymidylate kinase [Veillonella sp.]MBP9516909.1 thymidylate kinase [Veillonella sp.]